MKVLNPILHVLYVIYNFIVCMLVGSLAMLGASLYGIVSMLKPVKGAVAILFVGILLTSCTGGETYHGNRDDYDIVVLDGCQYIKMGSGETARMAHKGNCTNPIHCHNQNQD